MIGFIQGIYLDLNNRVEKMINYLVIFTPHDNYIKDFSQKSLTHLNLLKEDIQLYINNGELAVEGLATFNLLRYNQFFERYQGIEQFSYLPVLRYGKAEIYFNTLIERIYKEIRNDQPCPLITTISNSEDYYWAYPYYELIAVPYGEYKTLLNVPDLYHEIAHFLFSQYGVFEIIEPFQEILDEYFEEKILQVKERQSSTNLIPYLDEMWKLWKDSWIEEYSCDLIATYLTGAAYAWTNFKITTLSSSRNMVFQSSATHPSDESRMRVIFNMLDKLGLQEQKKEIKSQWQKFLNVVNNPKTTYYKDIFPNSLLKKLTAIVLDFCNELDLKSYNDQLKSDEKPIAFFLNEAWEKMFSSSQNYVEWEKEIIGRINSRDIIQSN